MKNYIWKKLLSLILALSLVVPSTLVNFAPVVNAAETNGVTQDLIISEYVEAMYESVTTTYQEIDESNELFSKALALGINDNGFDLGLILETYKSDNLNRTMDFNQTKIYSTNE